MAKNHEQKDEMGKEGRLQSEVHMSELIGTANRLLQKAETRELELIIQFMLNLIS